MAWRDASISHVKNGIYGEMWVAGMIAAAFVVDDPGEAIEAGLSVIPSRCRLAEAIRKVLEWKSEMSDLYDSFDLSDMSHPINRIHAEWDETRSHDWCHTISNAMIVAAALLWGDRDFERTICMAVSACFDTDCNGATAGSVLGAMLGAEALPAKWTSPLNDTLETGIQGIGRTSVEGLANETLEVIKQ